MGLAHFTNVRNDWDWDMPARKQQPLFTEAEMIEYGIQSIQTINENTFAPRLLIKLTDGRQISYAMSRNMIEDLKYIGVDTMIGRNKLCQMAM